MKPSWKKRKDVIKSTWKDPRGKFGPKKHGIHKSGALHGVFINRTKRMANMLKVLSERKWKFSYQVEAVSPRGFKYCATGASVEEAFMKAFSLWKKDLFVPAAVKVAPATVPVPPAAPKEPKQHLSKVMRELLERLGPELSQPALTRMILGKIVNAPFQSGGPPLLHSDDPILNRKRLWRRLYMRAYRRPTAIAA